MDRETEIIWIAKATALVRHCCALAGMEEVVENITVEFCKRKRTTIGTAWTHFGPRKYPEKHPLFPFQEKKRGGLVRLSSKLFLRAPEEECVETITHEIAHILANLKAGKNVGHKDGWKAMMKKLGYPNPSRCHTVDLTGLRRKQKRFNLSCPACKWLTKITAARRTRWYKGLKKGILEIRCKKCGYSLSHKDLIKAEEIK